MSLSLRWRSVNAVRLSSRPENFHTASPGGCREGQNATLDQLEIAIWVVSLVCPALLVRFPSPANLSVSYAGLLANLAVLSK